MSTVLSPIKQTLFHSCLYLPCRWERRVMWSHRCSRASRWRETCFSIQSLKRLCTQVHKRACWSLWQARPCSRNVVYWNSTTLSKFIPPKTVSQPTVSGPWPPGTIPRFSAETWTSIIVYSLKERVMDWRNSGYSCGFSDHHTHFSWDIYQPEM